MYYYYFTKNQISRCLQSTAFHISKAETRKCWSLLNWAVTHMVNLKSITTFVYITEKCKSMTTYSNSFENEMVKVIFLFTFWNSLFEFDDDKSEFDDDPDLFTPTQHLNRWRLIKWNRLPGRLLGRCGGWCNSPNISIINPMLLCFGNIIIIINITYWA